METAIARPAPAAEAPAVPAVPAPASAVTPVAAPAAACAGGHGPSDAWAMATAFGTGGLVALAGVALGWALARRSQRR